MKKIGLFIGIDAYDDKDISQLNCAARDARELASVFKHRLNYETLVLTHDDFKKGRGVNEALRKIGDDFKSGGLFVFYFAGHGNTIEERNNHKEQLFLLPSALAKSLNHGKAIGEGVISYGGLRAITDSWENVQSAYILDVCRIPLLERDRTSRDAARLDLFKGEEVYRSIKFGQKNGAFVDGSHVLLNACHNEQKAEELNGYDGGHGLFTASLLETLKEYHDLRRPVVLDDALVQGLHAKMKEMALFYDEREINQKPLKIGVDLELFHQEQEDCAALIATFELQLAAGKLDRPIGDNCLDTLRLFATTEYNRHIHRELSAKLQVLLDTRKRNEKKLRDEQRFNAASLLGTGLAFSNYLATCELCEHKEQAKKAIELEKIEQMQAGKRQADLEEKVNIIARAVSVNQNPLAKFESSVNLTVDEADQILTTRIKKVASDDKAE